MTKTVRQPIIDIGAEASGSTMELVLVLVIALLAFAYLMRGFMRKRRRSLSGEACGGCAGCGSSGGTCHIVPKHLALPDSTTDQPRPVSAGFADGETN